MTCCIIPKDVKTNFLVEKKFLEWVPTLVYLENVVEIVENSIKLINLSFGCLSNNCGSNLLHRVLHNVHSVLHVSCVIKSVILVKDIEMREQKWKNENRFEVISRVCLLASHVSSILAATIKSFQLRGGGIYGSASDCIQLVSRFCALKVLYGKAKGHHYKRDLIYHITGCAIDVIKILKLKKRYEIFKPLTCVIAIIHSACLCVQALHKDVRLQK